MTFSVPWNFYAMYFIHIHLPSPGFSQIHHPFLSSRPVLWLFLKSTESNLHCPYILGCVALPVKHSQLTPLKKIDSPPGSSQLPIAPQLVALWSSPSLGWDSVCLEPALALCMLSLLLWVQLRNSPAVSRRAVPCSHARLLAPSLFPPLSLQRRGDDIAVPLRAKHSPVSYSLHLGRLLVFCYSSI